MTKRDIFIGVSTGIIAGVLLLTGLLFAIAYLIDNYDRPSTPPKKDLPPYTECFNSSKYFDISLADDGAVVVIRNSRLVGYVKDNEQAKTLIDNVATGMLVAESRDGRRSYMRRSDILALEESKADLSQ